MIRSDYFSELGVSMRTHPNSGPYPDEFLTDLRGIRGVRKYREMRDSDATVGAVLTALNMILCGVEWRAEPASDKPEAEEAAEFVDSLWSDMETTWDDVLSDALSVLPFGFSVMEMVFKRRGGRSTTNPMRRSIYDDGLVGIRSLSPRPQWTIHQFRADQNGRVESVVQSAYTGGYTEIPISKCLHFTTLGTNNDPSGRSILRTAYKAYYSASHIERIEAIAIERELNGLPLGRLPMEILNSSDAGDIRFRSEFAKMLANVRRNEQSYMIIPSDVFLDTDDKPSPQRQVDVELLASNGSRDIDASAVVTRYKQDIARSVLADFVMLGQSERGSFALSKSKTDLFLRAAESHLGAAAATFNRQLMPRLWGLNGFDYDLMPELTPGAVANVDLEELGKFITALAGAGAPLFPDDDLENYLRGVASFPERAQDDEMLGTPEVEGGQEVEAEQ